MPERRNLGEILNGLGRISLDQQTAALEYQKEHGGFFGEALIDLGFISSGELEFGLASQFDLPYIFPDPEAIDRDVARLVSPAWALANLAVPISRHEGTLVVVVDSPLKDELMADLHRRTGFEVEMAIASPERIRGLIREIYDGGEEMEPAAPHGILSVDAFLERAFGEAAEKLGVSIRGNVALGWWKTAEGVTRVGLAGGWARGFQDRLMPSGDLFPVEDGESPGGAPRVSALVWEGREFPVRISTLGTGDHREVLFTFEDAPDEPEWEFEPPPESLVQEVRLLRRSGSARFAVRTLPAELESTIFPVLPELLFGREVRYVHLARSDRAGEAEGRLVLPLPDREDAPEIERLVERLRSFDFDILTLEESEDPVPLVRHFAGISPTFFVSLPGPAFRERLAEEGILWEIEVSRQDDGQLNWRLIPLNITL